LFDVEVRSEQRYYSQMLDALARSGFGSDTLAAELVVSKLFGTVWAGQRVPRDGSHEESFGLGLVDFARHHASPTALALMHAVAAVAPIREVRHAAADAVVSLVAAGVAYPEWVHAPGAVFAGRCWAYEDVFGDETIIVCEFAYRRDARPEERHGILMQIDHVAFSASVNVMLVDMVDETVRELTADAASSGGMTTVRQVDPAWARAMQARGLARADLIDGVPLWPRFGEVRALAQARLGALAESGDILPLDPEPPGPAGRAAIVAEFLASPSGSALTASVRAEYARAVAGVVVDHGCAHDPGNVLRVSPAKWESFLQTWWPQRTVDGPWPAVLAAWSEWAAENLGLPVTAREDLADVLADLLDTITA
jgi:hypothetical protein